VTVAIAIVCLGLKKADVIRGLGRRATVPAFSWLDDRLEYGVTAYKTPEWWMESSFWQHLRGRPADEQRKYILDRLAFYATRRNRKKADLRGSVVTEKPRSN